MTAADASTLPGVEDLGSRRVLPLVINGVPVLTADVRDLPSRDDRGPVRRVAFADPALAAQAAGVASLARGQCASSTRAERSRVLRGMADALERDAEGFAISLVREVGKTVRDARGEVARSVSTLRAAADAVGTLIGTEVPVDSVDVGHDRVAYTMWQPIGVVLAICGFNFPLLLAVHKLSAAIGAGCPILIKPSERTPFTTVALGRVAVDSGWPAAAISVINGGPEVGSCLTADPHVALVSFTGSSLVGARIAAAAGASLKRVVLELGSNAATIVAQDADLDLAVARCAVGGMSTAGQSCISVQRIIVHRDVEAAFRDRLAERLRELRTGDPADEQTDVGRLVADQETTRVRALIDDAVGSGGVLVTGPGNGPHLEPTLVAHVPETARMAQEEVFGPVVATFSYSDDADAVRLANSTAYGLMAGVFTSSLDRALYFAEHIEAGGVHINDSSNFRPDNIPYGGVKASGVGKEGPGWAMREFSNEKIVTLRRPGGVS